MNYFLLFVTVIVGFSIATALKNKTIKHLSLYLSFSGAFLLAITIFELLPEVFSTNNPNIPLFIIIGLLLQITLEFFSKGAEHGHFHQSSSKTAFPFLLFLSLSLHALIEGMPIAKHNSLVFAIIIHKLPIALILTLFLYKSGFSKIITFISVVTFAIMTPLGLALMNFTSIFQTFSSEITAVVIGVILHVSTVILFESSKNHTFNLAKFATILFAFTLAYFI